VVFQAHLVLEKPRANETEQAAGVQQGRPHLALELANPRRSPSLQPGWLAAGIPPQRDEAARLTIVTSSQVVVGGICVQRPAVGYGAIVAQLLEENGLQRERHGPQHDVRIQRLMRVCAVSRHDVEPPK